MADIIQIRRDTAANWTSEDTLLAQGELGLETDTGKLKIGDGMTAWTSLPYWQPIPAADDVSYDNVSSGLSATDVQAAIDEIVAGGGGGPTSYGIVTESSASTATVGTNDGLFRYNRCGGDVTFDNAEAYTAGMAFNIRATATIELIEDGVTLTPPAGGTLELTAGMAVQVVMTSGTAGDVIGQTVASP